MLGLSRPADQLGQLTCNPATGDRGVRNRGKAFPRHVIDKVQHPEASPARELVVHEVQ